MLDGQNEMDRVVDDETGQLNSVVDFWRSYSLLSFSEFKQIGFGLDEASPFGESIHLKEYV